MKDSFFQTVVNIYEKYQAAFWHGALTTMQVALIGTILGLLIGLMIGVIRTVPIKKNDLLIKKILLKTVNTVLAVYIEVFRGTPMIVQAAIVYYGSLEAFNINMTAFAAGLLVVSINTGAYMAEIVRGGINSIDRGQFEAAHAVGMSHWQTMFRVVLPQTIRNILPATSNEFVINIKDTSVLNIITLNELFFTSKSIAGTSYKFYQTYLIACAIYFVLTFTTTRILRLIEKKLRGSDSYTLLGSRAKRREDMGVK